MIEVTKSMTIAAVKAKIQDELGFNSELFNLMFRSRLLDVDSTIASNNIVRESPVYMVMSLQGGGKRARATGDAVASAGRMDKEQKLASMHEQLTSTTMMARTPLFATQDTEDVLARMRMAEAYMIANGGKMAFQQMLMGLSREELKELMSQLDTSNVESRFNALGKMIGRQVINRAETRQKGHQKIITIVKDTITYIASHAFLDRKGTFSWEDCTQMIITVVEEKARNGDRAAAANPVNNAFADVDMMD
jgi:arsenate reductase-like glutaredoxin family protein